MPSALLVRQLEKQFAKTQITVPVVYGGAATRGFWTDNADELSDGTGELVKVSQRSVVVIRSKLPEVKRTSTISVDGANYTVRDTMPVEDGLCLRIAVAG